MAQDNIYRSKYPVIYVYAIDDDRHRKALKVGMTDVKLSRRELLSIDPCGNEVEKAAKDCIRIQTSRSATLAEYKYSELGFYFDEDGDEHPISDHLVHRILAQNGFEKREFPDMDGSPQEWYVCELKDVQDAIRTIKTGHNVMRKKKADNEPIEFREEQERAIRETIDQFKIGNQMLWNAKMRFGKTLCSLELIRKKSYSKTLIVTHRPAVRDGWFSDYGLLDFTGYAYGCKLAETSNREGVGETFATLQRDFKKNGTKYIYFASMQDLRGGSDAKEGGIDKNHEIFADNWDLIIVDEAHEGTQTSLGKNVLDMLRKKHPKMLYLSGTPYNILHLFSDKEIFTWDYNMEQSKKEQWYEEHPGEPNPYAELPRMNIRTFRLRDNFEKYYKFDEDYFNFAELFRTWTGDEKKDAAVLPSEAHKGRFVHEDDVRAYLELMHKQDSLYPFSTEEYRELFAHTFWIVPGVKEAKALSALLLEEGSWWQDPAHKYRIVNVAGDGDDPAYDRDATKKQVEEHEKKEKDALEKVKSAVVKYPRTITISCGRLTTGVTVKPWTGVFMLKGNGDTKAAFYMQTIFRAQSPCKEPFKTDCYAFDFAPDRTITVVDEYLSSQPHNKDRKKRPKETVITEFLKFCSVISIDGSKTTEFDTKEFITQVNRAYKECIIRQGFKGRQLYVDLYQLSPEDRALLDTIDEVIKKGSTKGGDGKVKVNEGGVNTKDGKKKQKQVQTTKNKNANAERKKQRDRYQLILDTLSVRLPMMVFGEVDNLEHFDMDAFVNSIEKESWEVFMPKGITQDLFKSLLHLYNTDAILASFNGILEETHKADELPVAERAKKIAELLATFHFPDKETVLTPWRVVNLHMTDTIGGYDFYDEQHSNQLTDPRFVQQDITDEIFADAQAHVLEINAKSGVYPLWLAYTFFRYREKEYERQHGTPPNEDEQVNIWRTILRENIFVLCMSPMAVKITERALRGYHDYQTNCKYQSGLLEILKDNKRKETLIKRLKKYSYWGIENMESNKFDFKAVVGNPPYQLTVAKKETENGQKTVISIFHHFQLLADDLGQHTALIYPGARWIHRSGKGLDQFGFRQINDPHLSRLYFYPNASEIFSNVSLADGISIVEKNRAKEDNGFEYIFVEKGNKYSVHMENPGNELIPLDPQYVPIVNKIRHIVQDKEWRYLSESVLARSLFAIESDFVEKNPELVRKYNEGETFNRETEIKLLTNDKAGKAGKAQWFIANRNVITSGLNELNRWKVVVSSANAGGQKRENQLQILDNYSAFGRSRVALKTFDTEEEAKNFYKYVDSEFVRFALLLTDEALTSLAKLVPDLGDYTNANGIIDFSKDVDAQLYELFDISKEEQQYIKSVLNKKGH